MLHMHKKRYEELERYRKRTNGMKFAEGLLLGTAMGLLAGMILAPKPGKETLDDIKDETRKLVEKGKDMMHGLHDNEVDTVLVDEDGIMRSDELPEPEAIEFDMEMDDESGR